MINKYLNSLHEQEEGGTPNQSAIIAFLQKNPNPSDDDIHSLADKLKISPHDFEEEIYSLLGNLLKGVGKHQQMSDDQFDSNELKMGIEIETEHTDNRAIAKEITKDHLAECKDYYTRLNKMEKECEKQQG